MGFEKALKRGTAREDVQDYKGRIFDNLDEMCEHYNISLDRFKANLLSGMSLKDALTNNFVTDFNGNKFSSLSEMYK